MGNRTTRCGAVRDGISRTQPPPPEGNPVLVARAAPQLRRRLQRAALDGAGHSYLHMCWGERRRRRGRDHLLAGAAPSTGRRAFVGAAPSWAPRGFRSLARRPGGRAPREFYRLPLQRADESAGRVSGSGWSVLGVRTPQGCARLRSPGFTSAAMLNQKVFASVLQALSNRNPFCCI